MGRKFLCSAKRREEFVQFASRLVVPPCHQMASRLASVTP